MIFPNNVRQKVAVIKARHTDLERKIEMELKRPAPDTSLLARLKKQKLLVKDTLFAISEKFRTKLNSAAPANA